jgi:hypothetical protein
MSILLQFIDETWPKDTLQYTAKYWSQMRTQGGILDGRTEAHSLKIEPIMLKNRSQKTCTTENCLLAMICGDWTPSKRSEQ